MFPQATTLYYQIPALTGADIRVDSIAAGASVTEERIIGISCRGDAADITVAGTSIARAIRKPSIASVTSTNRADDGGRAGVPLTCTTVVWASYIIKDPCHTYS